MTENISSTAIKIKNIYKKFDDNEVLKDVNIEIMPGEFFTLLGSSGCGKTTLLRCIAGFEKPTSGEILFGDQDVGFLNPWEKNVGFVFQNYALWPHMTVKDNIAYGLKMKKATTKEIDEKIEWVLDIISLPGIKKRYPGELSGGQQQRVSIARALVISPQVLLLDEPLSNLDAKMRIKMRKDIKEIQKRLGITAVYVTHDQEEALEISDRIAVMEKGVVKQIGIPEDIYERPQDPFTANFVGKSNFIRGRIENGKFLASGKYHIPLKELSKEDGDAVLCFRPENVNLYSESEYKFQVKVVDANYRGSSIQSTLSYYDEVEFSVDTRKKININEEYGVVIEKYQFFDKI